NSGHGYDEVARGILNSAEFRTNSIQDIYGRFLQRAPSTAEVDLWSHALDAGLTEKQLQAQFLASSEYTTRQANEQRDWLSGLYQDPLGGTPDAAGLAAWNQALQQGTSRATVALEILNSPEANARVVTDVYHCLLGRNPDGAGLQTFVARLGS